MYVCDAICVNSDALLEELHSLRAGKERPFRKRKMKTESVGTTRRFCFRVLKVCVRARVWCVCVSIVF